MSEHQNNGNSAGFMALESRDIEIERHGETRKFRARELKGSEASRVFEIHKPNGKRDIAKVRKLDSTVIAASVVEVLQDGTERKITVDEATNYGTKLRRELTTAALELNGIGDEEGKND